MHPLTTDLAQHILALVRMEAYSLLGAIQDNKVVLGGSAGSGGGTGDPPAGFVGQLTQSNVTYDTAGLSRACSAGSAGSSSLVGNLDAIRLGIEICDDAIGDRHIDWGHGAGQVDAEDVPFTSGSLSSTNAHDAIEEAWNHGGESDHGALTGLADDDHAQYLLTSGARDCTGLQTFNSGLICVGYTIAGAPAADSYLVVGFDETEGRIFAYDPVNAAYLPLLSDVDIYRLRYTSADTDVLHHLLRMEVFTSGSAGSGLGTGIQFQIEDAGGGFDVLGTTECVMTDATAGAEHGAIIFKTADIGDDGLAERARIDHEGNFALPKTSGTGIKIDNTTPTFGWRDLLGQIRTRGVGATDPNDATYIGNIKAYQFSVNDEAWIDYHIPHDYVAGTDIHLHFHWSHNSAIVTGGNVTWGADVTYAKGHNQAAFSATVNPTVVGNASTTQYQHIITEVQISASAPGGTQIDSDNLEPDGVIMIRAYLSANNITSSGAVPDPFLHFVDVHYQSTNIATKNKAPDFYA